MCEWERYIGCELEFSRISVDARLSAQIKERTKFRQSEIREERNFVGIGAGWSSSKMLFLEDNCFRKQKIGHDIKKMKLCRSDSRMYYSHGFEVVQFD